MPRPIFRQDSCKGCGLCIAVCPKDIIVMEDENFNTLGFHPATVKEIDPCIGCGFCAIICPDSVIEVAR